MRWDIALTIKPTMACNMRCKHCFNGDCSSDNYVLKEKTVKRFIELAAKEYRQIKITFHGGEPSIVGEEYYRNIFNYEKELIRKYNVKFTHFFTTNGLLLSDSFLELLRDNNTTVNFSFDGPYNSVLREKTSIIEARIYRAEALGVTFRVFCTICKESYKGISEIYDWFNQRKWNFKIAPIEPWGFAEERPDLILNPEDFAKELDRAYIKWIYDTNCQVSVGTFEEFARLRNNNQFKPYWFNYEIALNPDGNIYPFGRPNDKKFCLGNPFDVETISECFQNKNYILLKETLEDLWNKYCVKCDSYHVCRGVCMCMNYMYSDSTKILNYSCEISRRIFSSIMNINARVFEEVENSSNDRWNPYFYKCINENRN